MKLPNFLFKHIVQHRTSLGDNLAFPIETNTSFDYKILKQRLLEVTEMAQKVFGEDIDKIKAQNILCKYLVECNKIEEPIKEQLINICENTIHKLFAIPRDSVHLSLQLKDKIEPSHPFRILPEDEEQEKQIFDDLNDITNVNKVILKRRFINALIQGASYSYSQLEELYNEELEKVNPNLMNIYKKIVILNDFLLFHKKENISDKNPHQSAVVEVELGRIGEKTEINVQATNFIFLLTETIRGFFELFASHGLPEDNKKAMYIVQQADFLIAEPWDLRMGVILWNKIMNGIDDTKFMPYFFTTLCELPVDEFNETIKEILSNTKKGKEIVESLIKDAEKEYELTNIQLFIQDKNDNETLINDSYFSSEEIDDNNDEIIEEECFSIEELNESIKEDSQDELMAKMLINANWEDIDFNEEEINIPSVGANKKHMWVLNVIVNQTQIPTKLVYFRAESVFIKNKLFYQLHIHVDEQLRRKGIAFKLYKAFINLFGNAISLYNNRSASFYQSQNSATTNDDAINNLWGKLSQEPNIITKTLKNKNQEEIGIVAIKN